MFSPSGFELKGPGSGKGREYFIFFIGGKSFGESFVFVVVESFPDIGFLGDFVHK